MKASWGGRHFRRNAVRFGGQVVYGAETKSEFMTITKSHSERMFVGFMVPKVKFGCAKAEY